MNPVTASTSSHKELHKHQLGRSRVRTRPCLIQNLNDGRRRQHRTHLGEVTNLDKNDLSVASACDHKRISIMMNYNTVKLIITVDNGHEL